MARTHLIATFHVMAYSMFNCSQTKFIAVKFVNSTKQFKKQIHDMKDDA